jgi:hypothetical protein
MTSEDWELWASKYIKQTIIIMKTPQEKAKELVGKFTNINPMNRLYVSVNKCALISCDEVIEYLTSSSDVMISVNALEYWQQVKQEIQMI